jgi:hypothetical protein
VQDIVIWSAQETDARIQAEHEEWMRDRQVVEDQKKIGSLQQRLADALRRVSVQHNELKQLREENTRLKLVEEEMKMLKTKLLNHAQLKEENNRLKSMYEQNEELRMKLAILKQHEIDSHKTFLQLLK